MITAIPDHWITVQTIDKRSYKTKFENNDLEVDTLTPKLNNGQSIFGFLGFCVYLNYPWNPFVYKFWFWDNIHENISTWYLKISGILKSIDSSLEILGDLLETFPTNLARTILRSPKLAPEMVVSPRVGIEVGVLAILFHPTSYSV